MFFATKETVPEGLGFSTFDITHLLWLGAIFLFWVTSIIIYRKLTPKKRNIMRIFLGSSIIFLEIFKDIVAVINGTINFGHLPLHLCGINILLIAFDIFKSTKAVRSFLYYFCIPGALLAILFPNWTTMPCLNFSHIHSFVIHALLVLYPLLLVADGAVKANLKEIGKSVILLVLMAVPIYFVNMALDTNFMFLMDPEKGNPLGLFEQYLGNHLWGFPVLLPIVMFVMYIPLLVISKHKAKKL